MITERWVDVPGYEYLYQVSDQGRVRNAKYGRFLKPRLMPNGYYNVALYCEGRQCAMGVHRLVALSFIPNPDNLPQVNHINGNKADNSMENLEWCTAAENQRHRREVLHKTRTADKPVLCLETRTVYVSATKAAQDMSLNRAAICMCCTGKRKHTNNFHFKFKED